ncbi:MAG: radical SAM family heme chaperone HemW [Paracoccaceae bacterium]
MSGRRGFGLYVHWPFCQAKCPYCDFNSHVVAGVDQDRWATAFEMEIARAKADMPDATLDTVFFGGGTPSLMEPKTVDRILRAVRSAWPISNHWEVTLEANPSSVEADRFKAYASAGVNRVSLGIQALNDPDLKQLGRLHSADDARRALDVAQSCFDRVSFDLIYARQNQSLKGWETELTEALGRVSGHVSLYQLTIEPGTAFGDRFKRARLAGLPDEDLSADMYELTQSLTTAAGLPAYEISNHATPGSESKHNLIYWRGHDWLGIGPGAHGRFTRNDKRVATETHLAPSTWLNAALSGNGEISRTILSIQDARDEKLMMGLRLVEGIEFSPDTGLLNKIKQLEHVGLIQHREARLTASSQGRLVLNSIIRELIA